MSGVTGFFVAVSVVSAVAFILMLRSDRMRDRRRAYADSATTDSSGVSSGNDGFGLLHWFGGGSSSSPEDSCTPSSSSFFSGGDSSCSSDGGGDGGGGGGGGD